MGRLLPREGKFLDFLNQRADLAAFAVTSSFVSFIARLVRRVWAAGIGRVAASLSFTTLLGLVPLFTVAFAYVARFPLFQSWLDALEPTLLKFLLPGSSLTVRHYLTEFTARTATLQGIGTAFVVITAVLLVADVESEINAIWGIQVARSLVRRAVVYTLGFIAVPVSIAAAVYFTSWAIQQSVDAVPIASEALPFLARPVGLAIGTLVLTLTYALVPARRVPWRAALIAGLLAAIAFQIAKAGFAFYITHFSTYQVVYGTLAALPVFLIWLYLSWIILLVGAAVSATLAETDDAKAQAQQQ
jgi:membrane protein